MPATSTYDHRVIQGAESGLFLRLLEELLTGEAPLYHEIFATLRVPWKPWTLAADDADLRRDTSQKKPKVWIPGQRGERALKRHLAAAATHDGHATAGKLAVRALDRILWAEAALLGRIPSWGLHLTCRRN